MIEKKGDSVFAERGRRGSLDLDAVIDFLSTATTLLGIDTILAIARGGKILLF